MVHNQRPAFELAATLIFLGSSFVWQALKKFRKKIMVEDVGAICIKSAPQGLVEIQGYAWPIKPLVSPLSHKTVTFFFIKIEEYVQRGRSGQWQTLFEDKSHDGFFIADASGAALISTDRGEFDIATRVSPVLSLAEEERTNLETYLKSKGIYLSTSGFMLRDKYRVNESVIYPGSPLFCLGSFRTQQDMTKILPYPGLQDFFAKMKMSRSAPVYAASLVQKASTQSQGSTRQLYLALADQAAHGFIQTASVSGDTYSSQTNATDFLCCGMISYNQESDEKLFFADCHQGELIQRLARWQNLKLFGGALMVALSVACALWFLRYG